jgi:hypothetical protein
MRHVFFNPAYNRAVEEGSFLMERVPILAVGDLKSELSRWTDDTSVTFYSPVCTENLNPTIMVMKSAKDGA